MNNIKQTDSRKYFKILKYFVSILLKVYNWQLFTIKPARSSKFPGLKINLYTNNGKYMKEYS